MIECDRFENKSNIFESYRHELVKLYLIVSSEAISGQTLSPEYLIEKLQRAISGCPIILHTKLYQDAKRLYKELDMGEEQ